MRIRKKSAARSRKATSKFILAALLVGAIGLATAVAAWAAFLSSASNPGNSFAAGSVAISDNDAGAAMFSLSSLTPSSTAARCIKVTYTGSLASTVRLYGTTSGSGLDPYVGVLVTRGTYSSDPGFSSCTNFTADATTYITGQAAGVIYTGTLQGFADNYASGLVDPTSGSPESWTNNESHVYKFELTIGDNNSAAAKNATQAFTWEAQNS